MGKVSRARSRASTRKEEVIQTNRAICALRQLWSGSLDGSLLGTADSAWKASESTPMGAELAHRLRARARECVAKRPEAAPMGAAADTRQLGVRPQASGPPRKAGTQSSSSLPKRGDIWPAPMANVAPPPAGTSIVPIREISEKAKFYLDAFEEKMLISANELKELNRRPPGGIGALRGPRVARPDGLSGCPHGSSQYDHRREEGAEHGGPLHRGEEDPRPESGR